ncbi:MAG: hypothetical protein JWO89_937 [Verrucomicrobiaceae bacterium]|nr:hypothetical protein [Verrucomicrobiaceae bacterium]
MVGGALLSVPLFLGAQALLQSLHITAENARTWPMTEIAKADFERFFNRAVLVCALMGLPLMLRASRGNDRLLPMLQLRSDSIRQALTGFILAAGLLLLMGWTYCRTGVYLLNPKGSWTAMGQPIIAGLGAATVEEILFRGVILGLMLRCMSVRAAMLWTTFIFAFVHFLKPPEDFSIPADQVTWHSGLDIIGAIFGHFGNVDFILAEFFTLFGVGWVVVQARIRTGSLWPGIGLHAGWVFGLKYFSALTLGSKALRHGDYLPWIGLNLKIGLVPLVIVLFTGWLASLGWQKSVSPSNN